SDAARQAPGDLTRRSIGAADAASREVSARLPHPGRTFDGRPARLAVRIGEPRRVAGAAARIGAHELVGTAEAEAVLADVALALVGGELGDRESRDARRTLGVAVERTRARGVVGVRRDD